MLCLLYTNIELFEEVRIRTILYRAILTSGRDMLINDTNKWANELFGNTNLGDLRRTKRLVKFSSQLASHIGASVVQASGDSASIEGAYRLLRNPKVKANDIAKSGFKSLLPSLAKSNKILALEDTSTLSYQHGVAKQLGTTGSKKDSKKKGILAHSVLMVDAISEKTIGLGEQYLWCRKDEDFGQKHARKKRAYEDKESYKWQRSSEVMAERFAPVIGRIISVCDRESDIYEYIKYKQDNQQRFVVRASHTRKLVGSEKDNKTLVNQQLSNISYQVQVKQKGGRKARLANIAVRVTEVILSPPGNKRNSENLKLNMISCQEINAPKGVKPLSWYLYTNEKINTQEEALDIIRYYELRWRVEEFHKCWKSAGTKVESLRLQSKSNLEKMIVITAFVSTRLLQLRELITNKNEAKKVEVSVVFSKLEWQLLWVKTEKKKPPETNPSLYWAYYAVAKLGRWHDSKRTGIVGWNALWSGWFTLTQLLEGARLVQNLSK